MREGSRKNAKTGSTLGKSNAGNDGHEEPLLEEISGKPNLGNTSDQVARSSRSVDTYAAQCQKCFKHDIATTMEQQKRKKIKLKEIEPAAENTKNAHFILLEKQKPREYEGLKTCLALVADETAAVHFQFWGDECEAFDVGDIIMLWNGIFSYMRNNLVLRAGKKGRIEKVGEFTMAFVETPNMSEIKWVPHPSIPNKLVYESCLSPYSRVFPPSIFE